MNIIDVIQRILLSVPQTTDNEAEKLLKGLSGRGPNSYGMKLRDWLLSNPSAYPERIQVDATDHITDLGVDVLITGYPSQLRVGFQIKSDSDLKSKNFTQKLKAQITDARSWRLSLYVIILACSPTQDKYLHIANQIERYQDETILIIKPYRAAGLLKSFNKPLPTPQYEQKTWADFFIAIGKQELTHLYLDWTGLLPDQRFQPPREYKQILETIKTKPITILTGPPAIGKTFTAMQILWNEFQKGNSISWISPMRFEKFGMTEGSIPDIQSSSDIARRIEFYTHQLGCHNPAGPPLDHYEFITKYLHPHSFVYIEDPFGKTDDEFEYSLHTYKDFFDLHKFALAISKGSARFGCHILITSREHLFERCVDGCKQRGEIHPDFSLIHIGIDSYAAKQRRSLVRNLVTACKVANPEEATRIISPYVDVPFCAEFIVRDIEPGTTNEQIFDAVEKFEGYYLEKLRNHIIAESDSERLFLLLLAVENRPNFYSDPNFLC